MSLFKKNNLLGGALELCCKLIQKRNYNYSADTMNTIKQEQPCYKSTYDCLCSKTATLGAVVVAANSVLYIGFLSAHQMLFLHYC